MGDATIVPSPLATAEREAIALVQGLAPGVSVQLRIGEVIGEGGMGIIRAAEQIALVASGSNLVLTINVLLMWRRVPATR